MDLGLDSRKIPNPRENTNFFSIITFGYTFPIFFKGYKKELEVTDLYQTLSQHRSNKLGNKLEAKWREEEARAVKNKRRPSLKRAVMKMFGLECLLYGFIIATNELIFKTAQPIFLGQLIRYYMPNEKPMSDQEAYLYAGGIVGCALVTVFLNHPVTMATYHMGMKIRVACCSLVYRKALRLSKTALGQTTAGQIVNLLSNDVSRFDGFLTFANHLWIGPIQTVIVTFFLYEEVGVSAMAGVVFLLLFIPLQFVLAKRAAVFRYRTALKTDERVRLMNEIISGMQVIKMYTWEKPFEKMIALTRRLEIKTIRFTAYIRGILLSFMMFTTRVSLFLTILVYLLLDYDIDAKQVFVLTAFYNVLRLTMAMCFPQAIAELAEANVSFNRINEFLLYDETKRFDLDLNMDTSSQSNEEEAISIRDGTAKWTTNSATINNFNLTFKRGGLIALIGPVGSGKSSLLHVILKELPLQTGSLRVDGKISYASQEPWLFSGSVQQNIIFGQEMDKIHFRHVAQICALEKDFSLLPFAEKTIVGERGVSLSGGQRARINLARAVYKEADIYLLDDPLSAVDTHVGTQLFEECIRGYLREKTVILITHQLQYLKDVDHIVILEEGQIKAQGTFGQLQESGLDFAKLLNREAKDSEGGKLESSSRPSLDALQSQVSVITTASDETVDGPQGVEEQRSRGSISGRVYKAYVMAGANCCVIFVIVLLFLLAQIASSLGDYFISFWMNLEQKIDERELAHLYNSNFTTTPTTFWDFSRETCIYIYSGLTVATVVITIVRSLSFFTACMRSSIELHDKMFNSIVYATMRFFNTNNSGRILNRFSKDIGSIDATMPAIMMDCFQVTMLMIGIVAVVAVVNPWLMIPTLAIGVIFWVLRIFYLRTSRSIKRLEAITRSPVFAHLNASLQGITTIRAFGADDILEREFDNHQDLHSSAWFIFLATSRAFGLYLDIFCVIYIALVTFSFLIFNNEEYGGNVGLAITQALGLTGMFQWGMRQSAELENQMTSVERVLEYGGVEHERDFESAVSEIEAPPNWPEKGEIRFVNLSLKYFPEDPPVLKNLNVTIRALEKVGIVGRTGAGKSSLIAALFQLSNTEGSIFVDNVDVTNLGLHDLRSKMSIIPQEPVLFSGTLRRNLDPFQEYDDEVLWKVLEEVKLKEVVNDLAAGLNANVAEGGSNFSVGQRQLVCLARAVLRDNKILVLDEATANVDPQTDAVIQQTIRKKFADCTVLTIAHRLNTVMDSDKVLVMDAGKVVEFDHPHVLLNDKNGVFYGMVQQTGKCMAIDLRNISEGNYNQLQMTSYL